MTTAADIAVNKFHASLNVSDLNRSVAFYKVLFGKEAAKQRADYAKFELDSPPLVLSLIPSRPSAGGTLNHVGLRVSGSEELVEIQRRVEEAGFATKREDGVECCYARQTKFWITDPDRTLWEIYVFHGDIDDHGEGSVPEMEAALSPEPQTQRQRIIWEHRLPAPLPASIPHSENSVDEVHFEGTVNAPLAPDALDALIKDSLRVLRPGGTIRLHGLAGDRVLQIPLPELPGPAAVVRHVPAAFETMRSIAAAGFADLHFEQLSETAHFTLGGVPMREMVLTAKKPGYRPKKLTHRAVYLGPLAKVTDDFGNVFPRGEHVSLNIHDWQVLKNGEAAAQFRFLTGEAFEIVADHCCT
jgi:catechol 2,3-dioxygenase-like lactoylglutathione lyase family enzyme